MLTMTSSPLQTAKKNPKDYAAVKFDVAEALGEWMNCLYLKETVDDVRQYDFIHHRDGDGVSGITEILYREGHVVHQQPGLKKSRRPNLLFRLKALKKYIALTKKVPLSWKNPRRDITGVPPHFALVVLTEKETHLIHRKAKEQKVSVNSLLLWALDKAVHENLLTHESGRKWVAPLNMRPAGCSHIMGNYSSSIITNMPAGKSVSAQEIHQSIKEYLTQGIHWGSQIYSNMARFIGFKGTLKVAKNIKEVGTGVFSNVGAWPNEGVELKDSGSQIKWRSVLAPSTQILPVAGTAWQWQEHLSLNLQLHPSIQEEKTACLKVLEAWLENLLGEELTSKVTLHNWRDYPECPQELIWDL